MNPYGGILKYDALSKKGCVLIWTNNNVTSQFAKQSIITSKNVYNFDYLLISFRTTTDDTLTTIIYHPGTRYWATSNVRYTISKSYYVVRIVSSYKEGLAFDDCYEHGNFEKVNDQMIPYKVFGIKN